MREDEGRPESAPRRISNRSAANKVTAGPGLELIGDVLPDVLLGLCARAANEHDAETWRTLAMRLWTCWAYAELGLEEAA